MDSWHYHIHLCMFLYYLFIVLLLLACDVRVEAYVASEQQYYDLQEQTFEQAPESSEQPTSQEQGKCPWSCYSYSKDIVFTTCMLMLILLSYVRVY